METMDQKTERNARVQKRYDELMREGKHGHYETLFRVVREEVTHAVLLERRRAELLEEDIEALHMCLDREGVPRCDEGGAVYSMWGRVLRRRAT